VPLLVATSYLIVCMSCNIFFVVVEFESLPDLFEMELGCVINVMAFNQCNMVYVFWYAVETLEPPCNVLLA